MMRNLKNKVAIWKTAVFYSLRNNAETDAKPEKQTAKPEKQQYLIRQY